MISNGFLDFPKGELGRLRRAPRGPRGAPGAPREVARASLGFSGASPEDPWRDDLRSGDPKSPGDPV